MHNHTETKQIVIQRPGSDTRTGTVAKFARRGALVVALAVTFIAGAQWGGVLVEWLGHHDEEGEVAKTDVAKQLWTCGMHPQVIQDKPGNCPICGMALEPMKSDSGASSQASGGTAITIDPAVVQNMGVRVAQIATGPVQRTVRAVGYLQLAQPRSHDVSLRVSGWVEKLYAHTEGMLMKESEPLFELYSPEIQTGVQELMVARRSAQSAGPDQTSQETARVLLDAARRKLQQWGLTPAQVDELATLEQAPRTVTYLSPMTGEVSDKMIVQGSMVKMGERALRLVDRSQLWLDAQVYAQDTPFLKLGQTMIATVEGVPGREFEGEVIFISPQVDPTTRTTTVRLAVENPELSLRPGMFATATLASQRAEAALLVPREAILDTGTRKVVFVSMGDGHFEPRKVRTGVSSDDGNVEVLEGLAAGDMVVTSGQFLMDSESRMKEAIQKHLSGSLLAKAPSSGAHAHDAPAAPAVEKVTGSQQWNDAVDATFAAYLKISEQLGAVQQSDTPIDVKPLQDAIGVLQQHADGDAQKKLAAGVKHGADLMAGQNLDKQRESFKHLSQGVIALADASPPSGKVGPLFVHYCPMAPGHWLQANDASANPYYATEMKQCAEVQRTITAAK